MDKIYPLLPWLTIDQSTDWIRRLTNSPLTETDLIRLCNADQCAIYVDVGPSKFGSDEQTWLFEVVGSGYQRVTNPKALLSPTFDKKLILELHGQIFWTDENGTAKSGEFDWFSTFELSDVFPIFKSPSIKALAEKINAEEIADTERELKQLRASAESDRQAKELAMLPVAMLKTHDSLRTFAMSKLTLSQSCASSIFADLVPESVTCATPATRS